MADFLKGMKKAMMFLGIAAIVIGILVCANDTFVQDVIPWVVGILMIVFGLVEIVAVFVKPGKYAAVSRIVPGIMALAVGAVFCLKNEVRGTLLFTFIGMIILVDAVYKFQYAFELKTARIKLWWVPLLIALATLACAIAVLVVDVKSPAADILKAAIRYLSGAMLITAGVFDIAVSAFFGVFGLEVKRVLAAMEAAADGAPTEIKAEVTDAESETQDSTDVVPGQ